MMVKVAGVNHRIEAVAGWAAAARQAERDGRHYGLRLEPEPHNPHDQNAIAVYGTVGNDEWHIGYLDADRAKDVTEDILARGLPIAAELYQIWVGDGGYTDIKMLVLAPPGNSEKARRKRKRDALSG